MINVWSLLRRLGLAVAAARASCRLVMPRLHRAKVGIHLINVTHLCLLQPTHHFREVCSSCGWSGAFCD